MNALTRTACRSCGASNLETVLAFGPMPLANQLLTETELHGEEARFPLTLAFCPSCSLAQILETIPPEALFENYPYFSSFSDTMLAHAKQSTDELCAEARLGSDSLVVEIASNDGYQLQFYQQAGVPVLGIEPAKNIAAAAVEKGIPTRSEFFGAELANGLRAEGVAADVVLAYNVMAHVPDLNGFIAGIRTLLKDDGIAVIEAPHVLQLVENCEFDTIYHEHLCYFAVAALRPLFARNGLDIFRVREIPIHGGSLRIYVSIAGRRSIEASVSEIEAKEQQVGLVSGEAYRGFTERVDKLQTELVKTIDELRAGGATIAAYGAAAKGSTLLNFFGLNHERIDFVADRSPHKQGHWMAGVRLPVVAAEELAKRRPDYCLLLAWNFADEIMQQQRAYRDAGGRFITPLPRLQIL